MFIFELAIILFASKIAGDLSVKLGQPSVVGKLIIGIFIGPAVLGFIHDTNLLKELSQAGVVLLMYLAGLETDIREFKRNAKSSVIVGGAGVIVPLVLGYFAGNIIGLSITGSIFLGLLLSATSVTISVQALKELGQLQTKAGMTILGSAVIDDILVMIALAVVMSFTGGDVALGTVLLKKALFFGLAILAGWKAVPWFLRRFARLRVTESVVSGAIIICFTFAFFAEYTGVAAIIGAYIAGIAISLTNYKHEVFQKVETISYSVFVPIFFTSIGVSIEISGIGEHIWLILILSAAAVFTKLAGCAIGAKAAGFNWRNSLGIGGAMVSRGEVALIIAGMGLEAEILSDDFYTVIVAVVLVTTIATPILMKWFFRDQKSNEGSAEVSA